MKLKIVDLILNNSDFDKKEFALMSLCNGLASLLVIYSINKGAMTASYTNINFEYLLIFVIGILLYIISLRYVYNEVAEKFQEALNNKRLAILDKIRHSEVYILDRIGSSIIYSRITKEIDTISNFSYAFAYFFPCVSLVIFSSFYIAYKSMIAFFLFFTVFCFGAYFFLEQQKQIGSFVKKANEESMKILDLMRHIIMGFKETKINYLRNEEIYLDLQETSQQVAEKKLTAEKLQNQILVFSAYFQYILLACVVFILPRLFEEYSENIMEINTTVLFFMGPMYSIVGFIPAFSNANISAQNLDELEEIFKESSKQQPPTPYDNFKKIQFSNVFFSYRDIKKEHERSFPTGPIDLEIKRGETVFIIGGNGSGKSTFLKLLTAFYYPEQGEITLDDKVISSENAQNYRELFSIIFGDFHLFDKLYGISKVNPQIVSDLLKIFELDKKTEYKNNVFTQTNLSTGQKKRLGLLITLLEDRPIYILDEWAAEQDPQFRQYFYEVFIPEMKKQGKTIIAVTHDDRYFDLADKVIKFSEGKLEYVTNNLDENTHDETK